MASMFRQPNGRVVIQFKGNAGKRYSVRLGKVDEKTAEEVKDHVEQLVSCVANNKTPCKATDDFLNRLLADPATLRVYDRLAAVGLATVRPEVYEANEAPKTALEYVLNRYIEKRKDVGKASKQLYHQTKKNLVDYFGADRQIREITQGDAKDWRLWMATEAHEWTEGGLSKSTVNRRVRCAKQFFEDAVDHGLIPVSPFRKIKGGVSVNRTRLFFVPWEWTERILEACPDAEWRAIVALVRFVGIRCPSELLPLKWEDVNFGANTLLVTSPKTKHLDKPNRLIPDEVFRDVKPYLEDLLDLAKSRGKVKPSDYVITRYRQANANLRTQFERYIKKAGLAPWPKLFQNCRSSRETELIYLGYKIHEVCAWIGNSPATANAHYLQVLNSAQKADLERSAERREVQQNTTTHGQEKSGAKSGAFLGAAGHMQGDAGRYTEGFETQENPGKTGVFLCFEGANQYAQQDSNLRPAD